MSIFLAEPDVSAPVRTYANGVKVVRLHEYPGPARGSLSVVTEAGSVCGDVVRDEQQIAWTGSGHSSTVDVDDLQDTCRIPLVDLDLHIDFHYRAFLGVRTEGAIDPVRTPQTDTFLEQGTAGRVCRLGRRDAALTFFSALGGIPWAPNPVTNPHFKLVTFGDFSRPFFEGDDELMVIRAGTGEDGDYVFFLDTLYLVPISANDFSHPNNPWDDNDWRFLVPNILNDVTFDPSDSDWDEARDEDTVSWLGQYSVMWAAPLGYGGSGSAPIGDFQEGDDERTVWNAEGGGSEFDNVGRPESDLVMVAGSHFTPSHEIDRDDFDRTISPDVNHYLGEAQNDRAWRITEDHPFIASTAGAGWGVDGTQLVGEDGKYDGALPLVFPPDIDGQAGDDASVMLGGNATELGPTGADSTRAHPTLTGMAHAILEVKVATSDLLVAGNQWLVGFAAADSTDFCGVILEVPSSGAFATWSDDLYASLAYLNSGTRLPTATMDGPDLIESAFAASTFVKVKLEMRHYYYRAKVWMDGDSEPGSWMLEGRIPAQATSSPATYPWHSDGTLADERRRYSSRYPLLGVRYFAPVEDVFGNSMATSIHPVKVTDTWFQDFVLTFDSHGDDPSDISLRVGMDDESIDHGTVVIPYEAQRLVIGPYDRYSYNLGQNGWYASLWKDTGAPETQASVLTATIEKLKHGWLPQIYRRVVPA